MSPTLQDENLRRRLFEAHAVRSYRRTTDRRPFLENVVLTCIFLFYLFFFTGIVWHLLTDLPIR